MTISEVAQLTFEAIGLVTVVCIAAIGIIALGCSAQNRAWAKTERARRRPL